MHQTITTSILESESFVFMCVSYDSKHNQKKRKKTVSRRLIAHNKGDQQDLSVNRLKTP